MSNREIKIVDPTFTPFQLFNPVDHEFVYILKTPWINHQVFGQKKLDYKESIPPLTTTSYFDAPAFAVISPDHNPSQDYFDVFQLVCEKLLMYDGSETTYLDVQGSEPVISCYLPFSPKKLSDNPDLLDPSDWGLLTQLHKAIIVPLLLPHRIVMNFINQLVDFYASRSDSRGSLHTTIDEQDMSLNVVSVESNVTKPLPHYVMRVDNLEGELLHLVLNRYGDHMTRVEPHSQFVSTGVSPWDRLARDKRIRSVPLKYKPMDEEESKRKLEKRRSRRES